MSTVLPALDQARAGAPPIRRFAVSLPLPVLNLCVALWLLAALNGPFWRALWQAAGGWEARPVFLLSLPVFVLVWVWLALESLTFGRAARPVLAVVLLASAIAGYFMNTYGVVFDRTMIASIVETHDTEALELFSLRLVGFLVVFGGMPLCLLWRVRIAPHSWHRHVLSKVTTIGVLLSGAALLVAPLFQSYASLLRNHRELRLQLVPTNYLAASHSYLRRRLASGSPLELLTDATRAPAASGASAKPTVTILVIGETARAANFGLNGYGRPTTPRLAAEADVINFGKVQSCGTSTAVSLPCMFLDVGRAGFADTLAARRENLLDVLQRTGVAVLWRDNNSGCKGICDRVPHEDLSAVDAPKLCVNGECHDEILLHGLQEKLDALKTDALIVLHMKGSHGPAYYLRYPRAFQYFVPVCETNQLDRCERQSIVNAYDNTLRYTDHVLATTIDLLRRNASRIDGSLIYVSDHGESLGERGLYLHGLPYALAPQEQTHVPMIMWLSTAAQERSGIDGECLRRKQGDALSHDNLYHSVLGLHNVQTRAYRAERDLFHSCRQKRHSATDVGDARTTLEMRASR
jgi:lipid A ethanolaminephosphotransferase